jgi:chromosome partitioning protein
MATATLDKPNSQKQSDIVITGKNKIIAFLSQKGGVGKTTTATHARDWFEAFGSVGFVDADAQRSSSRWISTIDSTIPVNVIGDAKSLLKELPNFKNDYDFTIVDAPGSLEDVSRAILSRCDVVVIPCLTSQLDFDSNKTTIEMVEIAKDIRGGKPDALMFFNRAEEGTILLREAKEAVARDLEGTGIKCLDTVIHKRQCIMDVPGQQTTVFRLAKETQTRRTKKSVGKQGKSVTKPPEEIAQDEYRALFLEIVKVLNG